MRRGDLRLAVNAKDVPFPFEFGYGSAKVDLTSDTAVTFVNYGLTNDLDVGLAVPWVRVAVGVDLAVFTLDNVDVTPGGHLYLLPTASDAGLGDIAVTAKYRMWRYGEGGLASELDIRLPSGNKNQLRGTGVTRTLLSLIYSHGGKVSPHINVGYEFWSSAVPLTEDRSVVVKDRITYAFGFEFQPHPRTTLLIDVIGRVQLKGGQVEYRTVPIGSGTLDVLLPASKGLHIVSAVPGIKWNVAGNVLLTANILTAISNVGLRADIIPVFGLDWAF